MLESSLILLIAVIAVSLIFDYINGFNDTANAIATCVSTKALSVRTAVTMAAVLNFAGALVSTKVATTIGQGIVDASAINLFVVLSGVSGAIVWGLVTWFFGIPSSSSHALIGGLVGAVIAHGGYKALHWSGLKIIVMALLLSPIAAVIFGFVFMVIVLWICRNYSPTILNIVFRKLQIFSAACMAFAHATADAQKAMGVITLALVAHGTIATFAVPKTVMLACASAMALGTAAGGWRIIKTVGKDIVKLQPVHGFCVQSSASTIILIASFFGLPTSTAHVITSTIVGVGMVKRLSAVNWSIIFNILYAWVLTIPASAVIGYLIYIIINSFAQH